ncbi:MAG: NAD(P)-binding protein [Alicyclobacillaceae bacterium]|nr:NAD(P)-binding protein [Alicyclobacillaceae bacterium]
MCSESANFCFQTGKRPGADGGGRPRSKTREGRGGPRGGAGASGSVAAQHLAKEGFSVVCLEQGTGCS